MGVRGRRRARLLRGPQSSRTEAGRARHYLSQLLRLRPGDPERDLWLWRWRLRFLLEPPLRSRLLSLWPEWSLLWDFRERAWAGLLLRRWGLSSWCERFLWDLRSFRCLTSSRLPARRDRLRSRVRLSSLPGSPPARPRPLLGSRLHLSCSERTSFRGTLGSQVAGTPLGCWLLSGMQERTAGHLFSGEALSRAAG